MPVVVYPKGPPAPPTVCFTIVIDPSFVFVYVQWTFAPSTRFTDAVRVARFTLVPPPVHSRFVRLHPARGGSVIV